jgi:hypothetical protein
VPDDDDILEAYEQELDDIPFEPVPMRRSNRGFWMVAGTIALGGIVLLVEIFANRPMVNSISRTEHDLTVAKRNAQRLFAEGGTFAPANASGLTGVDHGRTYVDADTPAVDPGTVSVFASNDTWAAGERTTQGTCFYVKLVIGVGAKFLVADGDCTGREALKADQPQW